MTRDEASQLTYQLLSANKLTDWKVRLFTDMQHMGVCDQKKKLIYLNTHHIDTHPDIEVIDTIKHEIAHALTPNDLGHGDVWKKVASELGALPQKCGGNMMLNPEAIDAIRSGKVLEVDFVEEEVVREVKEIQRVAKYTITQLKDLCPICGKKAIKTHHKEVGNLKLTYLECGHFITKVIAKATPYEELISLDASPTCKHEWLANRCTKCPAAKLFKFQIAGARAIESSFGRCGVFDEQGLGKTIQSLAYLRYHPEAFPVLFIVKSGLKYQFLSEIFRWLGPKYMAQILGSGKELPYKGLKCYIMSYQNRSNIEKLLERFKDINLQTVISDECQTIKNPDSKQTQKVRKLVSTVKHFIPLSGTPWKNRGSEYFPVLNMLDPIRFNSNQAFLNRWVDYYYDGAKLKQGGIRDIKEFKEYTKDLLIRRERSEVDAEFPALNRVKFITQLEEATREAYDEEVSDFIKYWNQHIISGDEDNMFAPGEDNALARLQRMRHMLGLSKIPATFELAEEFFDNTDRKLAVFVHHKDVGQILLKQIKESEVIIRERIPIFELTSAMDASQRYDIQVKFNQTQRCGLIASTLASGEGLNLQTCSDAILHERQWNPANEEQVEGRFVRIGSTANKVNMTYVHAEDSLDTKLDYLIENKRINFHNAMNKGEMLQWNEQSLLKELIQSLISKRK